MSNAARPNSNSSRRLKKGDGSSDDNLSAHSTEACVTLSADPQDNSKNSKEISKELNSDTCETSDKTSDNLVTTDLSSNVSCSPSSVDKLGGYQDVSHIDVSHINTGRRKNLQSSIEYATTAHRLASLVRKFHSALLASAETPTPRTKRAESSIKMALELMAVHCNNLDHEIEQALSLLSGNIEQKSLLREVVSHCFGRRTGDTGSSLVFQAQRPSETGQPQPQLSSRQIRSAKVPSDQDVIIVDVFAMPVYGSVELVRQLLDNTQAMSRLTEFTMGSSYISSQSDCVALVNVPLSWDVLNKPSVLNALSSTWGYHLAHRNRIDPRDAYQAEQEMLRSLRRFEVLGGTRGFILPGVRVWKGSLEQYNASCELLSQWGQVPATTRSLALTWWQVVTSQLILDLGLPPGSLMIRPPASPLVAQAQTLAWHLTHQLYSRLNTSNFSEIIFETVLENTLALRAYGKNNRILAQSDVVDLFEVTTSTEDFSAVLSQECDPYGPRTQVRQRSRNF